MVRHGVSLRLLLIMTLVVTLCVLAYGAEKGFKGKWKGEIAGGGFGAAGARGAGGGGLDSPDGGFGFPGGGLDGPFGGGPSQFAQRGGAQRGGGLGGFGGGGGGGGGPLKVTLNLKTKDKDTKATGNITVGETTDDVKDGKIEGNRITFRAGRSPAPIYEYKGELNGDQLIMTRTPPAGARGATVNFILKRS
jgi:hypothetical protein